MTNRSLVLAALVPAALALAAIGYGFPLHSEGGLDFWVDGAAFSGSTGTTWQEIYWTFSPFQLGVEESLGQRLTKFRTTVRLADSTGREVLAEQWTTTAPIPDTIASRRRSMVWLDQIEAPNLASGSYTLSLTIDDIVEPKQGRVEATVQVPGYAAEKLSVSQIELASEIASDSVAARFRKGNLRIKPHPDRTFGSKTGEQLYYYAEIYGLPRDSARDAGMTLRIGYGQRTDDTLHVVSTERLAGRTGSMAKYGVLRLDDLPNGYYRLQVQVVDSTAAVLASAQANFKVDREMLDIPPEQRVLLEEQTIMEREGGEYYSKIEYILTDKELAQYNRLSPAGKREYLRRFWKGRDPNPKTSENEALREHIRRYQFADTQFREQRSSGSSTDRGRMYIKYGPPEEIESKIMESNANPVIIWKYTNGEILVFWDKSGVGKYTLVYSKNDPRYTDPRVKKMIEGQQ